MNTSDVPRWSKEEVTLVTKLYLEGMSYDRIENHLDRTTRSIRRKLNRLNIKRGNTPSYNTHYRCKNHGWILPKNLALNPRGVYVCPYCDRRVRGFCSDGDSYSVTIK